MSLTISKQIEAVERIRVSIHEDDIQKIKPNDIAGRKALSESEGGAGKALEIMEECKNIVPNSKS